MGRWKDSGVRWELGGGSYGQCGGVGSAESWKMLGPGCAGHRLKELGSNYT